MSCRGNFSSISERGPLGHVCTLRASGLEVESHAPTRQEAEEDAALALTQEMLRRERAARYPRSVGRASVRRRAR
ncbi:hypothetical protein JY651_07800 [Pyxidicoccus parkwayensis]|uniref:Uncharacterized protein n=1 Tax=Pyxidicoccus parkwayensis TaxID=2813578 RepID=A0ABX7P2Z3_9BACT|nr:double-stranded RNA binding motif domain-containing protein [Pyxidicoccus parkwaysis]QSQ24833.1 hypothetical protein JY651_07800 [Pyxidicoccus parkwaysis]